MKYRVALQRLAVQDLDEATEWVGRYAPATVASWLARFQSALASLDANPRRCPLARENSKVDVELREYHFGKRPHVFRVIFTIDDITVRILRIRRAQRRWLARAEIERAFPE